MIFQFLSFYPSFHIPIFKIKAVFFWQILHMTNRYQSASKSASDVWGVMGKMERTKMPHKRLQEQFYCKHENFICQYSGIPKKENCNFCKKKFLIFLSKCRFSKEKQRRLLAKIANCIML